MHNHSSRKHAKWLDKKKKERKRKHTFASRCVCVYVCVRIGRVVLTAANDESDASQWAHVRDYVRDWTGHSIMSRLTIRLPSDKLC